MKFAVIQTSGTQYQVEEGSTIIVDRVQNAEGKGIKFTDVLMVVDGEHVMLGTPTVSGVTVTGEVVNNFKGEKIRVSTFKAKSRQRRVKGFRHQHTTVKITKIHGNN